MTLLNRTQCSALRGIAIVSIFLHNYLHWLGPMVKENEYQFIQHNVDRLSYELMHPTEDILFHLISFFGHYGVPVFLFLSGYGLVQKYEKGGADDPVWHFIKKHYMKLFPMMLLGFALFAMIDPITPGRHHWTWVDVITQLTMIINVFPDPDHIIWPGPYWFFGLMMELYIVYRLLLYKRHPAYTVVLIAVCWALQAFCAGDPEGETLNRIRYNFIGGMLPFGMGLLLARYEDRLPDTSLLANRWVGAAVFSVSVVLTYLMSLTFHLWLWLPAVIVVLHVSGIRLLSAQMLKPLDWLGTLSAAIFVCHPIAREFFIQISRRGDILDGLALYVVATLVLARLFRKAM